MGTNSDEPSGGWCRTSPRRPPRCARRGRPSPARSSRSSSGYMYRTSPPHRRQATDLESSTIPAPPHRPRRHRGRPRSTRRRDQGDRRDVVEHGVGPELPASRRPPEHMELVSRGSLLQRCATDVDGGDGESIELAHLVCSGSRMTLNDNDRGRSVVRPPRRASLMARRWTRMRSDHRIEILAHELCTRRLDVTAQAMRRVAEHLHDRPWPADADRTVAVFHRRIRLRPECGGFGTSTPPRRRSPLPSRTEERDPRMAAAPTGDAATTAAEPALATSVRSSPRDAQQGEDRRRERVCTTDSSAANGQGDHGVADRTIGLAAPTVIAVTAAPSMRPTVSSTSVVVPEREIATTWS